MKTEVVVVWAWVGDLCLCAWGNLVSPCYESLIVLCHHLFHLLLLRERVPSCDQLLLLLVVVLVHHNLLLLCCSVSDLPVRSLRQAI